MCRVLLVFVVLAHERRRPVQVAVTAHPTAEWTTQQLRDAFPWDTAPRYLLRDRDGCYGQRFHEAASGMGIHEGVTAPHAPWQNAYVERLIGSIRRECVDHVIVLHASGFRRLLRSYVEDDDRSRTHLALDKDAPIPRAVEAPALGRIVEVPP